MSTLYVVSRQFSSVGEGCVVTICFLQSNDFGTAEPWTQVPVWAQRWHRTNLIITKPHTGGGSLCHASNAQRSLEGVHR